MERAEDLGPVVGPTPDISHLEETVEEVNGKYGDVAEALDAINGEAPGAPEEWEELPLPELPGQAVIREEGACCRVVMEIAGLGGYGIGESVPLLEGLPPPRTAGFLVPGSILLLNTGGTYLSYIVEVQEDGTASLILDGDPDSVELSSSPLHIEFTYLTV